MAKLTKLNIKSTQDVNANLVQKYPLIWWCNLVLMSILAFSCWAYYIKCEGFSQEAYEYLSGHATLYFVLGTVLLVGLIVFAGWIIYSSSKKK